MSVTIYMDHMSQPSRAVLAFCIANNIPYSIKEIRIFKLENRSPEFLKINPFGQVPAIEHNGFCLNESHAIMTYLASVFPITDHWYPKDPKEQAKIDAYLHWHHGNTRYGLAGYLFRKFFLPKLTGKNSLSPEVEKELVLNQKRTLKIINQVLGNWKFVGKTNQPSIADLSCYCECTMMKLIDYDFSSYPNIVRWFSDMEQIPGVVKAHEVFNKLVPKAKL